VRVLDVRVDVIRGRSVGVVLLLVLVLALRLVPFKGLPVSSSQSSAYIGRGLPIVRFV
jgi:hypothetical protein